MNNRLRVIAILLALLSQLLGGFAVLCDAGSDGLVLGFPSPFCCDGAVSFVGAETAPETDPESCECCQAASVFAVPQREDAGSRRNLPHLVLTGASVLEGRVMAPGNPEIASVLRPRAPAPPPLVGTVVLVC